MQELTATQEIVFDCIEASLNRLVNPRNPDTTFTEIHMDSLDVYEVVMMAQDRMGIEDMIKLDGNMTVRCLANILDEAKKQVKA